MPHGYRANQGSYGAHPEASKPSGFLGNAVTDPIYASSATISYEQILADGYHVIASTAPDFSGTVHSSATNNAALTRLVVSGLHPNTSYYFRAGALQGAATNYADVIPIPQMTLSTPTTAGQIYESFIGSITANWRPLPAAPPEVDSMTASGYRLEASLSSDFSGAIVSSQTYALEAATLTVSGLIADSTYYLRVAALNRAGAPHYQYLGSTMTLVGALLVWDGGGGNNNWYNPTNWNPNGIPSSTK